MKALYNFKLTTPESRNKNRLNKIHRLNLENHVIESYRNHEFGWNYNFQLFRKVFE